MSIDDRFDRLASLFLGDQEPTPTGSMEAAMRPTPPVAPRAGAVMITPLLAGNLPVLAHPWLWHVAARLDARPTALLRLAHDGIQVALLNSMGPAESECEDLAAWLLRSATVARRWFVVPRSGGEIDTISAFNAEEVVVVTGGDEAATVAAYQWVRRLIEAAKTSGRTPPLTPVAVVGCEEAAAKEAAATISTASQAFLGHPVPLAGSFPRLDRTAVSHQRFFSDVVQPSELFAAIATAGAAAWARGEAPGVASPPRPMAPRVTPSPVFEAPPTPSPAVRAPYHAPVNAATFPDNLASCIPGLWPVAMKCPGHPAIEFATDASGGLHLLASIEQVASLRAAKSWAQRHATLLRAGFPGLAVDPLPVIERVVCLEAPRAIEWHHCGMRLDLLVRTSSGWLHVPLNDEKSLQP